mmetsp:Transcript_28558/g.67877  ORF Transcript_28558/g.67877 Transcript_28558/m.67877 type:complete len:338 (+) Transcript_28558:1484-2497(+)
MHRPPVRLHKALEAHLLLQDVVEQPLVGARKLPVHPVVGAHGSTHPGLDRGLEGREIELPRRFVVHHGVRCAAVRLLTVEDEVLHYRHHPLRLHTFDVGLRQMSAEVGILPCEILKAAPVPRHPLHLHPGAEDHIGALARELLPHGHREVLHGHRVPGGRHGQNRGPDGDGAPQVTPIGPEPVRGVLHVQAGHAQLRVGRTVAHVPIPGQLEPPLGLGPADALQEAGLLLQAHALQGLLGLGPRVLPGHQLWQQWRRHVLPGRHTKSARPQRLVLLGLCHARHLPGHAAGGPRTYEGLAEAQPGAIGVGRPAGHSGAGRALLAREGGLVGAQVQVQR